MPAPVAALQAPLGDCCEPAPMPAPPSEAVVKKEQKIREVHVSAALMEEFLRSVRLCCTCKVLVGMCAYTNSSEDSLQWHLKSPLLFSMAGGSLYSAQAYM